MALNPFKSIENKIKKGFNSLGDSIRKGIDDLGNKVKKEVEGVANKAKQDIEGAAKTVKTEVEGAVKTVERESQKAVSAVESEVKNLPKYAERAAKAAVDALAKAVTKEGLKIVREMVKADAERPRERDRAGIRTGTGQDRRQRAAWPGVPCLRRLLQSGGHAGRRAGSVGERAADLQRGPLIGLIESLGPDSVDLGIDFEFALVVGSDALGVGVSMSAIPLGLFTRIGDRVLKECGVPA